MSLKIEGRKCVVCNAYLFEEDDVVFCPDCGAPHHRDCFTAVGKCKLADLHGTSEEYKYEPEGEAETEGDPEEPSAKAETKMCPRCGKELMESVQFCPYCGAPNKYYSPTADMLNHFSGSLEEELEDGIKIKEIIKIVIINAERYISKFRQLKTKKLSWNWAAFLLPHGWFAFRKMHGVAALIATLMLVSSLFTLPIVEVVDNAPMTENMTSAEMTSVMTQAILSADAIPKAFAFISIGLNLAVRVFAAAFGDWFYKKRVLSVCVRVRESEDKELAVRQLGGVNLLAFMIVIFAESVLFDIISIFI